MGSYIPCDSITYNSINFAVAKNHLDILADALRALGYTVTRAGNTLSFSGNGTYGAYANGKFTAREGFNVDQVKQAFGAAAVKAAAKKFGWQVQAKANNKFQIRKRA